MVDVNALAEEAKVEGYHVGHLFVSLMTKYPDEINQIEASTGRSETNASVLERSVRLAKCLRRLGLKPGDVVAVADKNHFDIHIPLFAAMMNGLPLVAVDYTFKYDEIHHIFNLTKPKIAFCQSELVNDFKKAAAALNLDTKIITFDERDCTTTTMAKFMDSYDENGSLNGFETTKFDAEKVYLWLIGTGGTTGRPKVAAFTHKTWLGKAIGYAKMANLLQAGRQRKWIENAALNVSPLHWVSGIFHHLAMPLSGQTKVQTPEQTVESIIDIINKYKPSFVLWGPPLITSILNHEKECDLTCFDVMICTGGPVYQDILVRLKSRIKKGAMALVAYGQTETMGPVMQPDPFGPPAMWKRITVPETKVDPETGKEVTEPNKQGELWARGPCFSEYYNSPEETAAAFTEDGWIKSGDIFYRDENNYYFFVDRIKMLIKYRTQHVVPIELEELIRSHPDVLDVGVTSIPHAEDGEHPVACVVRRPGSDVTADDIKQIVASKLSASKQLRGGVVFLDKLPMTSTDKLARAQLKKLVVTAKRE